MPKRNSRGSLISPGVILGALFFGLALFGLTVGVLWMFRPEPTPMAASTALVNIVNAPTATSIPPTAAPTSAPSPTSAIPPLPADGNLSMGAFVQISGTGGDGLRIRSEASLQGTVQTLGMESEVFQVTDGPREADGYTWWYLTAPYDETRRGWAVANYLQVIQNP